MTTGLIALYGAGFVAARIIARLKLDQTLLAHMAHHATTSRRILAATMFGTLVLSSFIPNFITILLVIPLVPSLAPKPSHRDLNGQPYDVVAFRITLTLGIIYAANIGGIASLVGSPANALLLLALESQNISAEPLTFLRWLAFGVPMALFLLGIAGTILLYMRRDTLPVHPLPIAAKGRQINQEQRKALLVITVLLGGAIIYSTRSHDSLSAIPLLGVGCVLLSPFVIPLRRNGKPLLMPRDLLEGLPWRGFIFAAVAICIAAVIHRTGLIPPMLAELSQLLPQLHPVATLLTLVTITIFLTEILSNSVTSVGMWAIALAISQDANIERLPLMLAISFASTSAFMTPVSTPATALAFGESSPSALRPMLTVGVMVNIAAAMWISICAYTWIPWVLNT